MPALDVFHRTRAGLMHALALARTAIAASSRFMARAYRGVPAVFFALRERLTAWRDRLPGAGLPASTVIAYGAVGIMAAILINDTIAPTPAISSVTPPPAARPDWSELPRAHGSFALEFPALGSEEPRYVVRRHRKSGGRKDEMTWGSADRRGVFAHISLHRPGRKGTAEFDPFAAVVEVAAQAGIHAELKESLSTLDTKFGRFGLVDMSVTGSEGPRACLATSAGWHDPRFGLVAWWCSNGPEIVALGDLACLIDRLSLMSAGGDDRLAEFFAHAELQRIHCGAQGNLFTPTLQRVRNWIDDGIQVRLRGQFAGR